MEKQEHIFGIHAWSVPLMVDDLTPEQWRFRPHGMSHALWILGHVVLDRKMLGNLLGMQEEITDRDRLFDVGTSPDDVPAEVEGAAILEEFRAVHGRFLEHLGGMTEEDLAAETDEEFPATPKTRLGALQFLLMHECYHVGQLGALRVMNGRGSWLSRLQQA